LPLYQCGAGPPGSLCHASKHLNVCGFRPLESLGRPQVDVIAVFSL
jgi:hypothetical protein